MALTLIKETGVGLVDANSYADVADGNSYHDGHLYASAWTAASDAQKAVALVMASRLIDAEFQFNGTRTNAVQGLQWPRAKCPEPDNVHVPISVLLPIPYDYVQYDTVPKAVVQATCEMERELLIADRTTAPADKKWVCRSLVAVILAHEISKLDLKFPEVSDAQRQVLLDCKQRLESEAE